MTRTRRFYSALLILALGVTAQARQDDATLYLAKAGAKTAKERSRLASSGIAIDGVFSDGVTFFGTLEDVNAARRLGFKVEATRLPKHLAHDSHGDGFPSADASYHDYQETLDELQGLVTKFPHLVTRISIGKSLEGRDLAGVRISSKPEADSLPTAIFLGCHHAREHLSVEVPLLMAKYLAEGYATNPRVKELLDTREVWIVPMVNPDGAEHDISSGNYKFWRKNRRDNGGGTFGVDLNRNYAKGFGGPGASSSPSSDIYHGPSAFSEPETAAVRDFVRSRTKATTLLSFHTFSELVLWPWGHTEEVISNDKDRAVFETMGKKMAEWNKYTPQKSSDLYVASGDTTDWAYDELGIFAFTFELSPSSFFGGGFYPGAKAIDPTFRANIEPVLYLIEKAADPYGAADEKLADPLGIL